MSDPTPAPQPAAESEKGAAAGQPDIGGPISDELEAAIQRVKAKLKSRSYSHTTAPNFWRSLAQEVLGVAGFQFALKRAAEAEEEVGRLWRERDETCDLSNDPHHLKGKLAAKRHAIRGLLDKTDRMERAWKSGQTWREFVDQEKRDHAEKRSIAIANRATYDTLAGPQ